MIATRRVRSPAPRICTRTAGAEGARGYLVAVLLVLEHLLPQQQRVAAARLLAPRPLPLRLGLRRLCRPKT